MDDPIKIRDRLKERLLEERIEGQREGLLNFSAATFPGGGFEISWHHRTLCRVLNAFARGEIRRLIITLPPRHSKSQMASRQLPALLLGRNPDTRIISASYSDSLAARMNRDVQRIMESQAYESIFPGTRLRRTGGGADRTAKTSSYFEIVGRRGYYRSAGVGGSITGFGADVAIIDDYCRNQADANSVTIRDRVWEWFGSTFVTRLEKDGKVLIMSTRWHEADLIGRLLLQASTDPAADQWTLLNLPAIKESEPTDVDPRQVGEALWPDKYSLDRLNGIKATIGSRAFTAMYQQRPAPEAGLLVQKHWWKYYDQIPDRFDKIIMSWDLSFDKTETSSYVVGLVVARLGANIYFLDCFRERATFTGTITAFKELCARWPEAEGKYVEKKANGAALIDTLRAEIPGIIAVEPRGSKVARVNAVSPRIEAGNCWLPKDAPWIKEFVLEWTAFPAGAHNDMVDAGSQAIQMLPAHRDDFQIVSIVGGTYFPQPGPAGDGYN